MWESSQIRTQPKSPALAEPPRKLFSHAENHVTPFLTRKAKKCLCALFQSFLTGDSGCWYVLFLVMLTWVTWLRWCSGWKPTRYVYILMPRICECYLIFTAVINSGILKGGDGSEWSRWILKTLTHVLMRDTEERTQRRRWDADERRNWSYVATSQGMKEPP